MNNRVDYSASIDEAINRYPSLQTTVKWAKENNIPLLKHCAKKTWKGRVYQHLFRIHIDNKEVWWTNEYLKNWLWTLNKARKENERIKR